VPKPTFVVVEDAEILVKRSHNWPMIADQGYTLWWYTSPQRILYTDFRLEESQFLLNWPVDGIVPLYSGWLHAGNPRGRVTVEHQDITLPLSRWCERRGMIEIQPVTMDGLEAMVREALGWRTQDELTFYGSFVEVARNALDLKIWA
jgi:hypothetical protein